jgi:hypothetical protein
MEMFQMAEITAVVVIMLSKMENCHPFLLVQE